MLYTTWMFSATGYVFLPKLPDANNEVLSVSLDLCTAIEPAGDPDLNHVLKRRFSSSQQNYWNNSKVLAVPS